MSILRFKTAPPWVAFLAIAAVALPARAQMGGGGGGGGGSGGIPLSGMGKSDDGDKPSKEQQKQNAAQRALRGVVTDADGNPVVGAVVKLTNARTQKVVSLVTREKGEYSFSGLIRDDNYQIKATFKERESPPHTLSTYDPRPAPVVNLQLSESATK